MSLAEYVIQNAVRGDCQCGQCVDAPPAGMSQQPTGHTADLTFFKVAAKPEAKAEALLALVKAEQPKYLDGKEHSYIEIGADLGDQGVALMLIGLGGVLGLWKVLSPETLLAFAPAETKMRLAQNGYVSLVSGGLPL